MHRIHSRHLATSFFVFAAFFVLPAAAHAQDSSRVSDSTRARRLGAVTVTATRTPTDLFNTPAPVNVIDSASIRERQPNTAADLFRNEPGLDVNGVGTNQIRPTIRGLRGQRILLLEDGLRMNNSRRQQDFGELPALVDVNDLQRIEVVRGPLSVLYGTDAIGGVVNLITSDAPGANSTPGVHGLLGYRHASADDQKRPYGMLEQHVGAFGLRVSGSYRDAESYNAPSGSFGAVKFGGQTRVNDTGVRDHNLSAQAAWDVSARQRVFMKGETYHANDAGFGYVDPAVFGADQPLIQIRYPKQNVDKYTLGYRASGLGSVFADRAEVTTFFSRNTRDLDQHIFVPFGPGTPPGAGVDITTHNFTDLATLGGRAEATKVLSGGHVLTYGADVYRDQSDNTDTSTTSVVGFGPPHPSGDGTSKVPNATFRTAGVFVQTRLAIAEPLTVILGARAQDVQADTRPTGMSTAPLVSSHERPVVGTASALYQVIPQLNVIASVGRGFRTANLIERFFEGPTPEGSGYQRANPNLGAETSLNLDFGVRARSGPLFAEAFVFRNDLRDGIAIAPTGDSVNKVPAFRNVNVGQLRYQGGEGQVGATILNRITAVASFSRLTSTNVESPLSPIGDSYSRKATGDITYRDPDNRFWAGYVVRHNGEQGSIAAGSSPVGLVIPSFTVHSLRGGVTVLEGHGMRHTLTLAADNLTNTLYSEFSNASFFRPETGRNLIVSYAIGF
ncbi:MAG: TonB-dependent receptor [Gemmatimonadota bacterium]